MQREVAGEGLGPGPPLPRLLPERDLRQTHWGLALFLLGSTDAAGFTKWPDVIRGN